MYCSRDLTGNKLGFVDPLLFFGLTSLQRLCVVFCNSINGKGLTKFHNSDLFLPTPSHAPQVFISLWNHVLTSQRVFTALFTRASVSVDPCVYICICFLSICVYLFLCMYVQEVYGGWISAHLFFYFLNNIRTCISVAFPLFPYPHIHASDLSFNNITLLLPNTFTGLLNLQTLCVWRLLFIFFSVSVHVYACTYACCICM